MDYIEDLNYMLEELEKKHLFLYFAHTKEEVENYKEELIKKYPMTNDSEFRYVAGCLLAYISESFDQHTTISEVYNPSPFKYIYKKNKLYIVDGANENNFKYVVSINGIEIKKLIEEYLQSLATPTMERIKSNLESLYEGFNNQFILRGLPSIDSNTQEFTYELDDGTILKVPYKGNPMLEEKPKLISYEEIDGVFKITYPKCDKNQQAKIDEIVEKLKVINNDYLIIDLRGNAGGSSGLIEPILKYLKNKTVYVLTDYNVFSSGIIAMNQIKNNSKETIFVGERVGGPINSFGNVPGSIKLPHTHADVRYSTRYNDRIPINNREYTYIDNQEKLKEMLLKKKEFIIPRYYNPDILIEPTIEDIEFGHDPILDYAVKEINLRQIKL